MKKGITLTELLLAVSIFAVIAVAIYSTFSMGVNAWRKMDGLLERYQEMRLLLDRAGLELRNCVDMDLKGFEPAGLEKKYDLEGKKDAIFFFTIKGDGIKRVIYKKEENKEFQGKDDKKIFLLQRQEENFTTQPYKEASFKGEIVLDLLSDVEFRYLKRKAGPMGEITEEWTQTWGEKDNEAEELPSQILIRIIFMVPTGKIDEYQEVAVDKYVDIPSVSKK